MIYVTGDTHGSIDIRKLLENQVTDRMTENDFLIICGDFGLIWNYKKEIRKERKWLDWLNDRPWTTLFADGNHECFPRLNAYPVSEWHGGKVHVIRKKVMHLMRGEIFEIEGNTIFVMGGASSHDRGPLKGDTEIVQGKSWWPEEIPDRAEMDNGLENLKRYDNKVDYIITHCLPTGYQDIVKRGEFPADAITDYLETIDQTVSYRHWYSGHYHVNIDVNPKVSVVFSRIMPIGLTIMESETMLGVPKFRRNDAVLFRSQSGEMMGVIKEVHPWGPMFRHDEPYYGIMPFETELKKPLLVKETEIIEKSLIL